MTLDCEMCPATASSFWAYVWHLNSTDAYGNRRHPSGDLARAVERSLLGETLIDEAPAKHKRIWDRWDRGGRSGPVRQIRAPTICPGP